MTAFDMPPLSAGFPARGRWLIDRLMADLALTENQAAGIVGNLGGESGLDPDINEHHPLVPGSRGGFGIAQWTGSRRAAFETWAANEGLDVGTDEANYGFLIHELQTTEARALAALRKTLTVSKAVDVFQRLFERPSDPDAGFAPRLDYAKLALAGPRVSPVQTPPPTQDLNDTVQATYLAMSATVRALQTVLKAAGYNPGPIDGIPGERTDAALKAWQARRG
jgi:hypothetical protein